jgi:hypothetical protein
MVLLHFSLLSSNQPVLLLCLLPCRVAVVVVMEAIINAAVATLQDAADVAAISTISAELYNYDVAVHCHPMRTAGQRMTPGLMPAWLLCVSEYRRLSSLLHDTAMAQLQGTLPLGNWEPVMQVRGDCPCVASTRVHCSGDSAC